MSFRPVADLAGGRSLGWRSCEGDGLEHLTLRREATGLRAEAVVIGARGERRYGVSYRVDCDDHFAVTGFEVRTTGGGLVGFARRDDGWYDASDNRLPGFDGCVDIDLAGSPFTNTLPIRRETWQPAQRREFAMLYIPFDSFVPQIDRQVYTCLGPRLFRYEAADGSFSAELTVDEDGLVVDYPTLFQRL